MREKCVKVRFGAFLVFPWVFGGTMGSSFSALVGQACVQRLVVQYSSPFVSSFCLVVSFGAWVPVAMNFHTCEGSSSE